MQKKAYYLIVDNDESRDFAKKFLSHWDDDSTVLISTNTDIQIARKRLGNLVTCNPAYEFIECNLQEFKRISFILEHEEPIPI